ncbi:fimbria/pilus outer membrane usher protein [Paraburkholderia sp. J67]|uniref:fimbria/pilus outer membrane usher protein n=1 Tax=Paraburkholderia sp. J67 TaxID=2805435 RepID=UPI002ABD22C5|nr:fimbria/pilus outer membrane usher protein [Paraburkholderia sp. J67]
MDKHNSKTSSRISHADPLTLSQASVAVLLAFVAAHAKADGMPDGSVVAPPASTPAAVPAASAAPALFPATGVAASDIALGNATAMPAGQVQTTQTTTLAPTLAAPALLAPTPAVPTPVAPAPVAPIGLLPLSMTQGTGVTPAPLPAAAEPAAVEFNTQFLSGGGAANLDISRFDKGNVAAPGHYRAALYVNQVWIGVTDVTLRDVNGPGHSAQPVFDRDLLQRTGVDVARLPDSAGAKLATAGDGGAAPLPELIPQATATFDMGEQRLDVSIPQAMMSRNARGWVDPKFWDDGVPAASLQYNANVYHTNGSGLSTTQGYLGLNAGINVGAWRFRYNGNVTNTSGAGTHVQSMQTYLQRSFAPIKSQLTIGDSYTDGSIFDSFGVRGVQIGTDDRMYPESQRGYAPTVRGIANSNAKVEVRQNGNILYTTTVAPGPFEINDLYPTGYGGDLEVVVTEADGSQHVSAVPYAAPVNALRAGRWRYNVAAGQYRNTSLNSHPFVFEAGVQHGLNNLVTLYGGTIAGENYFSVAGGAALNTPIGAFAADVTQANSNIPHAPSRSGQSLRLSYSRLIAPTNTNLTLAAYRYSTNGFLSYDDAMTLRDAGLNGTAYVNNGIQKGRLQLTVNQSLGDWGALYASGFTQNYWNKSSRDTSFQVGYNTNFRRVGVGVSASRELDVGTAHWDNRVMLNLSIPLDIGSKVVNTSTSFTHDSRDNSNQIQESFTGTAGQDNQLNYGVSAGYVSNTGNGSSVNANVGYLAPFTQMRANAGYSNGYTQGGAGLTGSLVAYQGGVALSSQTGDTLAVIEAKDAVGARVSTSPGVRVDTQGHAVIAGMQPYSQNTVEIDTKGLPMGVQLKSTEQHFAPTAGAVVRVKFETENRGRAVVMRLHRANGTAVPFGADVLDASGNNIGTVSQGSRAMFYSKDAGGDLRVKWGEGIGQSCKLTYALPVATKDKPAQTDFADASCQ